MDGRVWAQRANVQLLATEQITANKQNLEMEDSLHNISSSEIQFVPIAVDDRPCV